MNFFPRWKIKTEKINAHEEHGCALKGLACVVAAIVISGIAIASQPASASSYAPVLSIPNLTTVNAERGIPGAPPDEGYWDMDWPQPGEQSHLSAFVVNNGSEAVSYVLVFQIRYVNNMTQTVAWQTAELEAEGSQVVSVLWTPDHPGYFEIDVFAVSDLDKPAPLSDAALYQTFSQPGDILQRADFLSDLVMSAGQDWNQTGILGTFSYLGIGDSGILVPKNSTRISSGDTITFELSDADTWFLKETSIQYYRVGEDLTLGREFDGYYEPANFPQSFDFLESASEKEYVIDLPKGDYVLQVRTTFQYKMGYMLLDEGDGYYYFRLAVG